MCSAKSCPTLCDPMDCSPPGSSVCGILQARIWSGLSCPPPGDPPDPGIEPQSLMSPAMTDGVFTTSAIWAAPALFFLDAKPHPLFWNASSTWSNKICPWGCAKHP